MNPPFLIVLSIITCTCVISALSTHEEVGRGLDTVDAASNGLSIERNLRHDLNMTTSDQSTKFEDRAPGNTAQILNFEAAKEAFENLSLHTTLDKLFERWGFGQWVVFVHRHYKASAGDVIIHTLLTHYYTNKDLATHLLAALRTPDQRDMAIRMQTYQDLLLYWDHKGKTSDDVFKLLKLDEIQDASIEYNDLMYIWVDYVRRHTGEDAWPDIYAKKIVNLPHLQRESKKEKEQVTEAVGVALYARYTNDFVPLVRTN